MTMPDFWSLLHVPTVELLGWALLHFIWQGALMAAVLAGVLHLLREHAPTVRYAVSCGALVLLLALPIGTGVLLNNGGGTYGPGTTPSPGAVADEADVAALVPASAVRTVQSSPALLRERAADWLRPAIPWVVIGWALGVLVLSLRLGGGAWRVRRLRNASVPAPDEWSERIRSLARRVGLRQAVSIRLSAKIDSPLVAGWWRPVVLVPVGLLSGLPPQQVEALLLHELAHVRRHDVLVGRFQTVVESLLFFHPATWWISRQVRRTREACCDDLAVRSGTDRTVYARALASLAQRVVGGSRPVGALAASDAPLLQRIRRVLAPPNTPEKTARRLSAVIAVALIGALLIGLAACASQQPTGGGTGGDDEEPTIAEAQPPQEESARTEETVTVGEIERERRAVVVFGGDSSEAEAIVRGDRDVEVDSVPGGVFIYTRPQGAPGMIGLRREIESDSVLRSVRVWSDSMDRHLRSTLHPDTLEPHVRALLATDSMKAAFEFDHELQERRAREWELRADSTIREFRVKLRPKLDSVRSRLRMLDDSLEHKLEGRIEIDSLQNRLRLRADSVEHEFRMKMRPELLEHRARLRALDDSLDHERGVRFEADSVRGVLRLRADSLARRHEEHADSLRIHFREMERRMEREMPKRLREQARRLREQAERLEERAREMEEAPPEPKEPSDTTGSSQSSSDLRFRDAGRFWMGPMNEERPTTRFHFDRAPSGWTVSSPSAEYAV